MKMTKIALAAVLAMGATAANAGNWYMDAKAGTSIANTPATSSDYSWDDSSSTYELNLGYRLSDSIALEGGYTSMVGYALNRNTPLTATLITGGKTFTAAAATYKHKFDVEGFTLGANITIPVTQSVEYNIRGGILFWTLQQSITPTAGTLTHAGTAYGSGSSVALNDLDGNDPYLGVAATYKFSESLRIGLGLTRWFAKVDGTDIDVDTWTANLRYNF